jgi:hypothetical protein
VLLFHSSLEAMVAINARSGFFSTTNGDFY